MACSPRRGVALVLCMSALACMVFGDRITSDGSGDKPYCTWSSGRCAENFCSTSRACVWVRFLLCGAMRRFQHGLVSPSPYATKFVVSKVKYSRTRLLTSPPYLTLYPPPTLLPYNTHTRTQTTYTHATHMARLRLFLKQGALGHLI